MANKSPYTPEENRGATRWLKGIYSPGKSFDARFKWPTLSYVW